MQGALRGAGDTTWPFYGKVLGLAARLAVAALALSPAVAFTVAGVNVARFWSGTWQAVAREAGTGRRTSGD